jgi:peptidoglycan/LPS O-acetylase OafA/YrhL
VIGWRFIKLLHKFNGEDFSPFQAWLALAAGVGVSILSAWLMYKLVESSSLRVCHRIRMDQPLTLKRFKESLRPIHSKRDF